MIITSDFFKTPSSNNVTKITYKKLAVKVADKPAKKIKKQSIAITAIKNGALQELEKSNNEALINCTDDFLWSVSSDFKLVAANNAFIKGFKVMTNITFKPGDNLLIKDVLPEELLTFWKDCYTKALLGESFKKEIYIPAYNNYKESWTETNFNPVYKAGIVVGIACYSRNITEKKLAEEKLRQSEARLMRAQEVAKLGSWETDLATLKVIWSEETFRIFDIEPASLATSHPDFLEFVHPEDRATVDDAFVHSLNGHSVNTVTHRIVTKSGVTKIVEERWLIYRNAEERPVRAVGTCQDITEQKKAEAAINKAHAEKNIILESIDDGFFAVDKKSLVTYWNKKAEMLLNTKRENIIGKNLHEVFATPDSMAFYNNYQKAIRENATVHFEEYSKRTKKWFAVSAYASSKGLSVYFKDVSDRKKAEQLLSESEAKYRAFFENSMDGILLTVTDGKILAANPAACEIFRMTEEDICNAGRFGLVDISDPRVTALIKERQVTGKAKGELTFLRKDGSTFPGEINSVLFTDSYGQERTSMIIRDITERKQAERHLIESNERYNLVSKATNDMVWDWNLVTGKVYRNKEGWRKIFRNREQDSEVGSQEDWDSRIHPEDIKKVKLVYAKIQSSKKDFFEVECRMMRDDGTYAYILDRANIIRNEMGKPVRLIGATQDITERKEAEQQVVKSESYFRSLVQNSSDLIGIIDEKGYYLYSSPGVKKILGYDATFMIGKNAFSFIHPDDAVHIKTHLAKKNTRNYQEVLAFRFKNAKGAWRWLESKVTDMSNNPDVQGYIFNSRDVTERKITEEEINKLSIIARETVNAVIITDAEEKIIWVNEAFTRITEYDLEEVVGKKPGEFLQGEETNLAVVRFMRNEIKNVKAFECDIINYSKSGRKYWMRIQSQPQFDETGKLKYFFAIETDITKEKEAEEILKASEERYRYLFNNNPASIFIWDIEDFKILEVNETAVDLYGYCREEFLTKTVFDLSLYEDYTNIKQFASRARQKTDFKSDITCKHINKPGEEMYMNISSHRIQFKGRTVILALATNITDKVFLEKELEKERFFKQQQITQAVISAQEQERHELGGELHDNINQILAGSLLYLGLAKKELKHENAYLAETETLITSAINEIRNLSHTLIPPSLNESELVESLKNIIAATQKSSGIIIHLQASDVNESSIPDKLKLSIYRIVQEQFNNILKHAGAQKVIVQLVQDNEKTMLSIKDDGVGFDTTKKANGVGLMNIKTRASLFNGAVTILSSPGKGCELRVVFN